MPQRPQLEVIAGPTASGKTALAVRRAIALGAEIVSADSQQVYRHFDIGTAKPSPAELEAVPHHLISVVEPGDLFSAARYQALADQAIEDIAARGKKILVVGGTGLYVRILLRGVVEAPPADAELRARLTDEAERLGRPALHERLRKLDPEAAERIQPQDLVRIIRALEILELTGEPASKRRDEHAFAEHRYPHSLFVLDPPREELYRAIDARTEALFRAGLVEEVRSLIARGYREAAPMHSVGYAQALAIVEGRMTQEAAIADAARESRKYAKRQLTWFRKEPGAVFLKPPFELPSG